MASQRVIAYRASAEKCRIAAAVSNYADIRDAYLSLAEQWEDMARQIEELEADGAAGRDPSPSSKK
jgi:hypothetical protein